MTINHHYEVPESKVKSFFVYVVKTSRGYLYTGISPDPVRRVEEHNSGKRGAKCLRGQRPVTLVWQLSVPLSKSRALKFEAKIKKLSHINKVLFLIGDLPIEIPK